MKIDVKKILDKAKKEKYAIGAFNAANIETLKAITDAAKKLKAPVIIEVSPGEAEYIGKNELVALVREYRKESGIPIIINLDHATTFEDCKEGIDAGFDYVHFDGSKLPYEENLEIAQKVVEYAHKHDVLVEGEIDHIMGSSADHTQEKPSKFFTKDMCTDPEKAYGFIKKTKIDTLAAFIGNLHGVYAETLHLDLGILKKLNELLPNTYLSLHGGSGIDDNEVKQAIATGGIVKVNVNSEMRIAFKETLQKSLNETDEIAIYKITPDAIKAVQDIVEKKIKLFGSDGKI